MLPSEQIFNANSIKNLTPATDSGSAWGNAIGSLGQFVKDIAPTVAGVYTSQQALKAQEKALDVQAAMNRNEPINPSYAAQQTQGLNNMDINKLVPLVVVGAVVIIGGIALLKYAKK